MQIQELLQIRKEKGNQIAQAGKVKLNGNTWLVPSQTTNKHYEVTLRLDKSICNCPDYQERGLKCKHIFAVEITITKQINDDGTTTITKKVTYSQNWPAYNKSQTEEKSKFMDLLKDLISEVDEPTYTFGRPKIPQSDNLFASALKVYTQFSLRRFASDLKIAKEKGLVVKTPCFASTGHFMQREDITPILYKLISLSSMPFKSVETKFAVDSTGFHTTSFGQYLYTKHRTGQQHKWIKVHACCGTKTNIITAVQVTDEFPNDSPFFIPLAKETHEKGFNIEQMSADKEYLARPNMEYIDEIGGTAFIPFKSNSASLPRHGKIWRKMYHYFMMNRDDYMNHYHNRSNIETTFHMIKMKFGDGLKSRSKTAQINEMLLKILCHNIVVLIHEINELGITPNFLQED